MFQFKGFFVRLIAVFYAAVMLVGSPRYVKDGQNVPRAEDVIAEVNVISDVHMEGNNFYRKDVYVRSLRNMTQYTPGFDALIMCGDNTMNGFGGEYHILNGLTARLLPDAEILPVCGNHDVGNGDGDFEEKRCRFIDQYNAYHANAPISRLWYSRVLDGCRFIALASDTNSDDDIVFSEEELNWFIGQLDAAAAAGVPALVACHYPLSYLDREFREAITAHGNVYYFSGHLHRHGISVQRINGRDDLWNINLPRETECDEDTGETEWYTGLGINLQITADAVTVNTYNFYTAQLTDSFTVPIVKSSEFGVQSSEF
ncbi:MAG: metallophosphoesterase [Clostridia bacterium]|nr:metallophosphoesterase [Clostridia bacterium]